MKKFIILILTILTFSSVINAERGYASGNFNRGYRTGRYNTRQRWANNNYGWGYRNAYRSNFWNGYYQPYNMFNSWPYIDASDEAFAQTDDDYYDDYDDYDSPRGRIVYSLGY